MAFMPNRTATDAPASDPRVVAEARNIVLELRGMVHRELDDIVVGYEEPLDMLIVASMAGGHVLLEGPPGIAKTLLVGAVARVLGVNFKRVQFTPDTSPEEIVGKYVTRHGETTFHQGAVFTNVLLADEINRTPPRTQSSLLEAMQERHVTVEDRTHWLPTPFMVIATQNPYEQAGIFPLPESQLDRFLFKLHLDYSSAETERRILKLPHKGLSPDVLGDVQPLLGAARLQAAQDDLDATVVPDEVGAFIVDLIRYTREAPGVVLGASPRSSIHMLAATKANARLSNRMEATIDDVIAMAPYTLPHRLIVSGVEPDVVIADGLRHASAEAAARRARGGDATPGTAESSNLLS